ncbi:hypothetical protein [Geobacter argillaceus]|uniref:Uncharacterized protein n=1 Tax=Geobacter argillaceus TaxID=345631 RepID=A0A562WSL4_9BACT|nr:hypothetical protein [Geobacter argillaceus]TWJ33160.1 hypothetical protein JN12_00575 [Geobacter argillaceus]
MFEKVFAELDERIGRENKEFMPDEWKEAVSWFLPYAMELEEHSPLDKYPLTTPFQVITV